MERSVLARAGRSVDVALRVLAIAIAGSLLVAAWRDVSHGYDIWYYHLPFAARLVGLVDASSYAFSAENAARFSGFPLLSELLQGIAWRVTGHVAATNLVSTSALLALPVVVRRLFAVPLHLALLALVAIPLAQIHATSSYVDLPANAAVAAVALLVWRMLLDGPPSPRRLGVALALAATAVNTKFQLVPIVTVAIVVIAFLSLRDVAGWHTASPGGRSALRRRALVLVLAAPVVFATPLKNVVVHGNPVWPVEIRVLGRTLPHVESAYAQSPPHLVDTPRPLRFVRSVLEVDNHPIASHQRWSLDQWAPADEPSCRMGGYFGAYVLANVAGLLFAALRRRDRETRAGLGVFAVATIVASIVPQSHELRYYMHWMLLLVLVNLALLARDAGAACGLVATAAIGIVAWSTSAGYLYSSGSSFAAFRERHVDRSVIEGAAPGERLCIARQPFTFLYAPLFDTRKDYAVQEEVDPAIDCRNARRIP